LQLISIFVRPLHDHPIEVSVNSRARFDEAADLLRSVIEIVPAFGPEWDSPENLHRDRKGGPPSHGANVSELTGFVRERWPELDDAQRQALFAVAEICVAGGHEPQSTAAATCFIENLTNEAISPEVRPYLGPESREYFDQWQANA
jgi:hypothetical protein